MVLHSVELRVATNNAQKKLVCIMLKRTMSTRLYRKDNKKLKQMSKDQY